MHKRIVFILAFVVLAAGLQARAQERAAHPVGIIGITSEVAPIEARIDGAVTTRIQGVVFTSGKIGAMAVVAARSGAGKVNASLAATLLADHFSPSAVVFTGTAGAIDADLNPADVVIATAVGYHDFGAMTAGGFVRSATRDASTGKLDPIFFPADPSLLAAARRATASVKLSGDSPRIREGRVVTGDAFLADPKRREEVRHDLNAVAVEMEGAAVAQVCARFGVPVIIIRSITDHADGGAENSYEKFLDVASRNAAEVTLATIRELLK